MRVRSLWKPCARAHAHSFVETLLEIQFCNLTYKKNFVKHIENLPQHISDKFIGDDSSITDIALKVAD